MTDRPLLSVVSPVFGAERILPELVRRIVEQSRMHPEVRGVRLSRNSGQHAAIAAGLAESRGEYVVVMDCDLQDDPSEIPRLLAAARDGHDVVLTEHAQRKHAWYRNIGAQCYMRLIALLTTDDAETIGRGSYSLLTRKVVDGYNRIGDTHAHYLVNIKYLGFEQTRIVVQHHPRFEGRSTYSFGRLLRHAVDGIVANSVRLLNLVVVAGLVLFGLSVLGVITLIVSYFVRGALAGFTSLMVVFLLMTGAVLCSVGVVGIYVGRIFEQSRGRPRYFVDQRVGGGADQ